MREEAEPALLWAGVTDSPPLSCCVLCGEPLGSVCIVGSPGVIDRGTPGGTPVILCFGCAGAIGVQHDVVRHAVHRAIRGQRRDLLAVQS